MVLSTKVNGKMINNTVMENKCGQMKQYTKDNIVLEKSMVKENLCGKMIVVIKVHLLKIISKE